MVSVLLRASACAALLLAAAACTTSDRQAGQALPASGSAVTPAPRTPVVYRSAFDGYQPDRETEATNWKQANDTVHTIGGWRSYARESAPASTGATR
jgi:hypothetical protein